MSAYADMPAVVELIRGDMVKPEPIDWIWPGWLAAGKLHVLAGPPGTGKTTIAESMAATMTCGGFWPDCSMSDFGSVVIWSGEDDPADTIVPRLIAAGADMARVHIVSGVREGAVSRPFDPANDVDALRMALAELEDVRLLIVDPLVSAVSGDSHKNAEVRRGLQPLVDLAQQYGVALIGITHFTKGTSGRDPIERVTGSLAFGALARVVLVTAKREAEDDKPATRFLARAKSNIGPDGGGFIYDLRQVALQEYPGVSASCVYWGKALAGSARDLLAEAETREDESTIDAAAFLREVLSYGPRPAADIYRDAEAAGLSRDAMKRAKKKIGAEAAKRGMTEGWVWRLPKGAPESKGAEGREQLSPLPSHPSVKNPQSAPFEGVEGSKGACSE